MDAGSAPAPRYSGASLVATCRGASHIQCLPTYEFRCRTCGSTFTESRPMSQSSTPATCPDGHDYTVRLLRVAGVMPSGSATPVDPGPVGRRVLRGRMRLRGALIVAAATLVEQLLDPAAMRKAYRVRSSSAMSTVVERLANSAVLLDMRVGRSWSCRE